MSPAEGSLAPLLPMCGGFAIAIVLVGWIMDRWQRRGGRAS